MAKKKTVQPSKAAIKARQIRRLRSPDEAMKPKTADLDSDKIDRLSRLSTPADELHLDRASYVKPALESVAQTLSPDQIAIKKAGDDLSRAAKDPRFSQLIDAMVNFRQGYAIAYRELGELSERYAKEEELAGRALTPLFNDYLIQFAMYQASKPFSEHDFMRLLSQVTLPWLSETIDRHSDEDDESTREARAEAEKKRRTESILLGFKHSPQEEEPVLTRERSLVLVGWGPAVLYLLDQIGDNILANSRQIVLRFAERPLKRGEQHARLVRIGPPKWHACCDSQHSLALCIGEHAQDMLAGHPDLVICDSLPKAYTIGFAGRPHAAIAGDAHRRFRQWCDKGGSAFIGAILLPDPVIPDLTAPEFEQLRTFTHLRPVLVNSRSGEPTCQLVIGNHATVLDVDRGELEKYEQGTIIVPKLS